MTSRSEPCPLEREECDVILKNIWKKIQYSIKMSFCIFHELELQINNSSYSLLFFKTFFSMLIYFGLFFQFFFT